MRLLTYLPQKKFSTELQKKGFILVIFTQIYGNDTHDVYVREQDGKTYLSQ